MNGNTFVGPRNRGPFDPVFGRTREELLNAFEYVAVSIVDAEHFKDLMYVFHSLHDFIKESPRQTAIWRIPNGLDLFITMTSIFSAYRFRPMDSRHVGRT